MRRRRRRSWVVAVPPLGRVLVVSLFCVMGVVPGGGARAQDLTRFNRELADIAGDADAVSKSKIRRSRDSFRSPTYVEERLTDGELFYRLEDYVRASVIFTDVVENFTNHRAYPDALFLLSESLFQAGDYLGARARFRSIVEQAARSAFKPFLPRSLGRLIEIAIRLGDFEGMEEIFERLERLPPSEVEAATAYYRAKYLYGKAVPTEERFSTEGTPRVIDTAGLEKAREAFESVSEGSPFYPQARYFVGVVYTLLGRYPQAVEAFRRVLQAPAVTAEHRAVSQLTYLALGRLFYETDRLERSIRSYQSIQRTSEYFDQALYEVAWVYIRQGDAVRAERALEVLELATPNSVHAPDARLLRANLLLRNGRLQDAEQGFLLVRNQFDPVRAQLENMVSQREDPKAYFKRLVQRNLEVFDPEAFLPPLARKWANAEGEMDRALSVVSDLAKVSALVEETEDLVERLTAAIRSPNAVNVFPDLRVQRQRTLALRNRLTSLRKGLVNVEGRRLRSAKGSLKEVRSERKKLERELTALPMTLEDYKRRDEKRLSRYSIMARELGKLQVELLGLDARVVAIVQYAETRRKESEDKSGFDAVLTAVHAQEDAVDGYNVKIEELERLLEIAKLQVGVGDGRHERDKRMRERHRKLVLEERRLLRDKGVTIKSGTDRLFGRADRVESILDGHDRLINEALQERVQRMLKVIATEKDKLGTYRGGMTELRKEAVDVVGGLTYANFTTVRQRFYDLVLQADVGRVDVSWADREEHRLRVETLTRSRTEELRTIDDEFGEIMDISSEAGE